MKGKKFIKGLTIMCMGIIGLTYTNTYIARADITTPPAITITNTQSNVVTISNTKLAYALRNLLGKKPTDSFYSDDFLKNENYKEISTTEGDITMVTSLNNTLDLSNTEVNDIIELVQFKFPSTLQAINLAGNKITNENLTNISSFLNSDTTAGEITIGNTKFIVRSDFSTLIKKINLNDNNIDLSTTHYDYLQNEKLILGLQNINNVHSSGLVSNGEVNPYYYIRNNDINYLSFNFKFDSSFSSDSRISIAYDTVTSVMDSVKELYGTNNDKFSFLVSAIPESATAYFNNYNFYKEFHQFKLTMDSKFKVERKSLLIIEGITNEGKLEPNCPISIEGFGNNSGIKVSYLDAPTSIITSATHKNYVHITIEKGNSKRTIPVEFIVDDTTAPHIELIGNEYVYSSINKEFNDPLYIAYDPAFKDDKTGDNVSRVDIDSNVDITTLGVYTITYTAYDFKGNSASVTRTVEIKERVLDTIILKVSSQEQIDGEDIVLKIQPEVGVDISNYKDIKYYWYINNSPTPFMESIGDSTTGASTITLIGDASKSSHQIYVKMIAYQKEDNAEIELYSNTINLSVEKSFSQNEKFIFAAAVAVALIIVIIVIITTIKFSKSRKRTYSKSKKKLKLNYENNSNNDFNNDIQVYKNYSGADITPNYSKSGSFYEKANDNKTNEEKKDDSDKN